MSIIEDGNWPELPSHLQQFLSEDAQFEYQSSARHALTLRVWHPEHQHSREKCIAAETRWKVAKLLLKRFYENINQELQVDILADLVAMRSYGRHILSGTLEDERTRETDRIFFPQFAERIDQEMQHNTQL